MWFIGVLSVCSKEYNFPPGHCVSATSLCPKITKLGCKYPLATPCWIKARTADKACKLGDSSEMKKITPQKKMNARIRLNMRLCVSLCQICALTIKVAHKSNTNRVMVMCFCVCSYDAPATAFIHHTSLVHQKAEHAKLTVNLKSQHSVVMTGDTHCTPHICSHYKVHVIYRQEEQEQIKMFI